MKLYELIEVIDKRTQCLIYSKGVKITWTPFMIKNLTNLKWYESNKESHVIKFKVIAFNLIRINVDEKE